ncbi:MAG TPA: DEAD/DEAH box helicase [Steroidobacteraceae bacterium]|nr:DEAD/DEAH box helicase [Steroidobacteraceae bacterium]
MPFTSLGLMPELTRALADRGYAEPTPVQTRVIPEILAGRDILAGAQTGTGKTAGFALPILQLLNANAHPPKAPRALVLVPTRELAAQVNESVRTYGKHLRLRTLVVFGGVGIGPQIDNLRRGTDILVATPGRLLDHAQQGTVDLSQVQILVLDEADRMLDMGFIADIRRVIKLLPRKRQNLMFSATYSDDIRRLAQNLLHQPVEIEVARRNAAVDSVEQCAYMVPKDQKRALLSHLIHDGDWSQVLIFTRTKHGANRLTKQLQEDGIEAAAIHGNKSQSARTQALANFKRFDVRALVATEVASRGLDIKELPHVVNYELPNVPEDYVHRIGRTGRAGATGIAVSLVAQDEIGLLKDIEKVLRKPIPQLPVPHFKRAQPQPQREAAPAQQQRQPESRPHAHKQSHGHSKQQPQGQQRNNRRRRWNRSRPQASAR